MYYLSFDNVYNAFDKLRKQIDNRFIGILGVLQSIKVSVEANRTYEVRDEDIARWYDKVLYFEDSFEEVSTNRTHFVKFSSQWKKFIVNSFLKGKPSIYHLISVVYFYRSWEIRPSHEELVSQFIHDFHIDRKTMEQSFDTSILPLTFDKNQPVQRTTLKSELGLSGNTFTFDVRGGFIQARPSQLSRAPFFQTLYSGIECLECLLISNKNIEDLYPSSPKTTAFPNEVHQAIFFGTPGSGKSHRVKELTQGKRVCRTTFHPDSDYASFVGCYKPTMADGEVKYTFTPQVFAEAYVAAWQAWSDADLAAADKEVYLVIEEINRGNCAQIFGDLFQLLDRDAEGYSDYRIKADSDLRGYLYKQLGSTHEGIAEGELRLPPNLRIFATMNTSDQSLFPMDSAFKRRWHWTYVPVDYREHVPSSQFIITLGSEKYRWVDFLVKVNARIREATDSEDKQMGNFFIKSDVDEAEFKSKVMFYLWHEVCRDEYRTPNNFFRTSPEAEFSFNDLYAADGLTTLQAFMAYLGVLPQP